MNVKNARHAYLELNRRYTKSRLSGLFGDPAGV